MKARRLIIALPLIVLLLAAGLYMAAQAWIESGDGKRALEQKLAAAAGMPVRLAGDLDIRFLPVPGVVGTDLQLFDPVSGEKVAGSRRYVLDLALMPLVRRQLLVERMELEWLALGAPGGARFALPSVAVSQFAVDRPAGLAVDLGFLGRIDGEFTWRPGPGEVDLDLAWQAEGRDAIALAGRVAYHPDRAYFDGVTAQIAGQSVSGEGCFLAGNPPVLNLDLVAGSLDLDALGEAIPGGQAGTPAIPIEVNLRLRAAELVRGGIRAVDTELEIGASPACP